MACNGEHIGRSIGTENRVPICVPNALPGAGHADSRHEPAPPHRSRSHLVIRWGLRRLPRRLPDLKACAHEGSLSI
jgi:hypothetical protein